MIECDEFYPIYGATLELVQESERGDLIMHFRDERGNRHTLNVKGKESKMKSFIIYLVALLIVAAGVALAVGAI